MKNIDKLLRQAKEVSKVKISELDKYDFTRLSMAELKELAYGEPAEERFNELIKMIER